MFVLARSRRFALATLRSVAFRESYDLRAGCNLQSVRLDDSLELAALRSGQFLKLAQFVVLSMRSSSH